MDGLVTRAVSDTTTGNESTFTQHKCESKSFFLSSPSSYYVSPKVYLIVIFVGLLVVVILAIMLSAWCCKGERPQSLLFLVVSE